MQPEPSSDWIAGGDQSGGRPSDQNRTQVFGFARISRSPFHNARSGDGPGDVGHGLRLLGVLLLRSRPDSISSGGDHDLGFPVPLAPLSSSTPFDRGKPKGESVEVQLPGLVVKDGRGG